MSITDELRKWNTGRLRPDHAVALDAIADRIDERHKHSAMSAMNDALYHANDESMSELGWVRLPKDADGVSVHVGDELVDEKGRPVTVRVLKLREDGWLFDSSREGGGMLTAPFHHIQPDSWERIIEDAQEYVTDDEPLYSVSELVERCRRLAGDA